MLIWLFGLPFGILLTDNTGTNKLCKDIVYWDTANSSILSGFLGFSPLEGFKYGKRGELHMGNLSSRFFRHMINFKDYFVPFL